MDDVRKLYTKHYVVRKYSFQAFITFRTLQQVRKCFNTEYSQITVVKIFR